MTVTVLTDQVSPKADPVDAHGLFDLLPAHCAPGL